VSSKSKVWWGNKLHERRTDPLLRYLWHARNADEHTLQRINQLQSAHAKVVEPTKVEQLERAMKNETRAWTPLGMLLLAVTDRGSSL